MAEFKTTKKRADHERQPADVARDIINDTNKYNNMESKHQLNDFRSKLQDELFKKGGGGSPTRLAIGSKEKGPGYVPSLNGVHNYGVGDQNGASGFYHGSKEWESSSPIIGHLSHMKRIGLDYHPDDF